jgi:hypothetical protein
MGVAIAEKFRGRIAHFQWLTQQCGKCRKGADVDDTEPADART